MTYRGFVSCWSEYEEQRDLSMLANDLSDWTGFILKIEGLLNWENPRLLLLVLSAVSTVFFMFHWYQPTIVATIGWIGLAFSIIGFIGPPISARITCELTPTEANRRYSEFCRRLIHARYLFVGFIRFLRQLRANHPVVYLFTCLPLLVICGFIGLQVGDLLLVYILTLMCILTPGIRYKGLLGLIFHPANRLIRASLRSIRYDRLTSIGFNTVVFLKRWSLKIYGRILPRKED